MQSFEKATVTDFLKPSKRSDVPAIIIDLLVNCNSVGRSDFRSQRDVP